MTGYESKRAMAQDKLEQAAFDAWWDTQPRLNETNPASVDSFEYWAWEGWHAALAQPAQEPVAWYRVAWYHDDFGTLELSRIQRVGWKPLYAAPPQPAQERNFCERCGKRTPDLETIHTCTPPQETI